MHAQTYIIIVCSYDCIYHVHSCCSLESTAHTLVWYGA